MAIQIAHDLFPHVEWGGGSAIHASVYLQWEVPNSTVSELISIASANGWAAQVFHYLTSTFQGFDWLIHEDEFTALMNVDVYRKAQGLPATVSDHMLTNPVTGNIFHLIARTGNVVGGIRFWADVGYDGSWLVGFRFRIEETEEEELITRERLRLTIEEATLQHCALEASGVVVTVVESPEAIGVIKQKIKVPQKVLVSNDGSTSAETSSSTKEADPKDVHNALSKFLGGESLM